MPGISRHAHCLIESRVVKIGILDRETFMAATADEWESLDWRKLEKNVFDLQKRIYRAEMEHRIKDVENLQKLLIKSFSGRCLAVRRVTVENQGKWTPGIDGKASLQPMERMQLIYGLRLSDKASAVRRIYIPKPGKTEKRPLGIPTIEDRARQTLALMVLEPQWEAKFEPNSYGFRVGRSCWDAIGAIFSNICLKSKYVLDADITKCFDRIDHKKLLKKLNTWPHLRRAIRGWLKSGTMENKVFLETDRGTPQGGSISPLLANIALHGMERAVKEAFKTRDKPTLIRYADDIVVLHPTTEGILKCKEIVIKFLENIGLELNENKTRITHTLEGENCGFDFLGFNIRQYRVGKTHSGKNSNQKLLGFKTIIKPSKEARIRQIRKLKEILRSHITAPLKALISRANKTITGWTNFYSTVCAKTTFTNIDHVMYRQIWRMLDRKHKGRGKKWLAKRFLLKTGKWRLTTADGIHQLRMHRDTPIRRHVKVKGIKSPYDGDSLYWTQRFDKRYNLHRITDGGIGNLQPLLTTINQYS